MTIEEFGLIDVEIMIAWITSIPLEEWPQQSRTALKPAMVTDANWNGFSKFIANFPGFNHMLSVVMPGHSIDPHVDEQSEHWAYRIHVPLTTNDKAVTIMDDGIHHMEIGKSYKMNTRATHAVRNDGDTPRIHFMYDVDNPHTKPVKRCCN